MNFLKIYGLQRSGTNYLEWMLRENFPDARVLVDETGWKHGRIPSVVDWNGMDWSDPSWAQDQKRAFAQRRFLRLGQSTAALKQAVARNELVFCFLCKNPYSWYASHARYRGFPSSPVQPQVLDDWVVLNRHWKHFSESHRGPSVFFRNEDLLQNPERCLSEITRQCDLRRAQPARISCPNKMGTREGRPLLHSFDSTYYREKRYLAEYSASDFRTFAETVPRSLLESLGYHLESSVDLENTREPNLNPFDINWRSRMP